MVDPAQAAWINCMTSMDDPAQLNLFLSGSKPTKAGQLERASFMHQNANYLCLENIYILLGCNCSDLQDFLHIYQIILVCLHYKGWMTWIFIYPPLPTGDDKNENNLILGAT